MKNRLKTALGASLMVSVFVFSNGIVLAHETGTPHEEEVTTQTTDGESEGTSPDDIKRRVAERKEVRKTRLTAAKQARVKNRCKASQGKLGSIQGRITGLETSRAQVYQNLVSRLTRLSDQLATHTVDTAELTSQTTELTALIETFNTDLAAYKTAVADLAVMDCEGDPEGFQASLESARELRTKAADSAKAIRTYLSETIKPTLRELRAQFAQNSSDNADTTEDNTSEDTSADTENQGEEN